MDIPVFVFTGFLESGKTTFIKDTLEDKRFHVDKETRKNQHTLVVLCEEGIEEYDESKIPSNYVHFEVIENEKDLTEERLLAAGAMINATQVIVEYNGMWQLQTLYEALPENWLIYQQMNLIDATTFNNYNANMRSLVVDKITDADVDIFNRVALGADQMPMHKAVRALNRNANIAYQYTNGKFVSDDIEDPLPFDINAPVIVIKDEDYALWYSDCVEDMKKYNGKTIKFKGIVATNPKFDKKTFAAGRHIMTCCVEDIAYSGFICKNDTPVDLQAGDWIVLTAKISIEFNKMYKGKGPVLKVISISDTTPPEQPVATF